MGLPYILVNIGVLPVMQIKFAMNQEFGFAYKFLQLWFQSILWDNDIKSTKHTLKEMIMHYSCLELPEGKGVIKSENLADIA